MSIIDEIEDKKYDIDYDNYLHSCSYYSLKYLLENGILCNKMISSLKKGHYNGKYYPSIMKYLKEYCNKTDYAYKYRIEDPMIIIDKNIKTIKSDINNSFYELFKNTRFPFRNSEWLDEYQVYKKICRDNFLGINYNFSLTGNIEILKYICHLLNELKMDIPVVDYESKRMINKDKVLSLENGGKHGI